MMTLDSSGASSRRHNESGHRLFPECQRFVLNSILCCSLYALLIVSLVVPIQWLPIVTVLAVLLFKAQSCVLAYVSWGVSVLVRLHLPRKRLRECRTSIVDLLLQYRSVEIDSIQAVVAGSNFGCQFSENSSPNCISLNSILNLNKS